MAYKTLTPGLLPGTEHIAKVSFGIASDSPEVALAATDCTGGLVTLFVPFVGCLVTDFMIRKITAFGSTGAMTMNFGDTDDDGFLESTDAVMTDATPVMLSMKGMQLGSTGAASSAAYKGGRLYATGDTLAIGVSVGTAKINAGLAEALIKYIDTREVGCASA